MDDNKKNNLTKSYLYILLAGSLWGTQGIFMSVLYGYGVTSGYISFLRMSMACIFAAIITLVMDGKDAFRVGKRTMVSCILIGIVCQGTYNIAYSSAVANVGMAVSVILLYTAPVFTSVMSVVFFKEHLTRNKVVAVFINIIGCVLTVTGGNFSGISLSVFGLICGLISGLAYAFAPIIGRIATGNDSPYAVSTYGFLFASIFVGLVTRPWATVSDYGDVRVFGVSALLALIPTAIPYVFYYTGLSRITESSKVPVAASSEVVVAALLGFMVLKEPVNGLSALGIVLVLASVAVMNLRIANHLE